MCFRLMAFLIFCVSTVTLASTRLPEAPVNIEVKFDHTFYGLKYNSDLLTYREGPRTYSVKIKACNKAKVSSLIKKYQSLSQKYVTQKIPEKSNPNYDVLVTTGEGKKLQVSRGSQFGTWLRDLPKKIMYFDAEARLSCKR